MKRREIRERLVVLVECLEDGDTGTAATIGLDLLDDLGGAVRPSSSCPECGLPMWPGQLPKHRSVVHGVDPWAAAA